MQTLTSTDLLEKLLQGYSLSALITPNPDLQDIPEHVETLSFPFVLLNSEEFWAKTLTTHFFADEIYPYAYAFNPLSKYSVASSYLMDRVFLLNTKAAYTSIQWYINKTSEVVWEYGAIHNDFTKVRNIIDQGASFDIALLSEDDIWYVQPVDLIFAFGGEDAFEIKTLSDAYYAPINIRKKKDYSVYQQLPKLLHNPILDLGKTPWDGSFLRISSNGSYQRANEMQLNPHEAYKQLLIFKRL